MKRSAMIVLVALALVLAACAEEEVLVSPPAGTSLPGTRWVVTGFTVDWGRGPPACRNPLDARLQRRRGSGRHGRLQLLLRHRDLHRGRDRHHRHRLDRDGLRPGSHGPRGALPRRAGEGHHFDPRRRSPDPGGGRRHGLHRPRPLRPRGRPAPGRDHLAPHHSHRRGRRLLDRGRHGAHPGGGRPRRPDQRHHRVQPVRRSCRLRARGRSRSATWSPPRWPATPR